MKFLLSAAIAAQLLLSVSAQNFNALPECSRNCVAGSLPKECGFDAKCICNAKSFIDGVTCCVAMACGEEDQEKTAKFASDICSAVGITNLPTSASCDPAAGGDGSNASASASPSASGSGSESSGMSSMSASSMASASASSSVSSASAASATEASGSASATAAGAASSATGSANSLLAPGLGVMGAAALGAVALL